MKNHNTVIRKSKGYLKNLIKSVELCKQYQDKLDILIMLENRRNRVFDLAKEICVAIDVISTKIEGDQTWDIAMRVLSKEYHKSLEKIILCAREIESEIKEAKQ